ncbi:cuticular protein analogous to peritrophins 1-H isoform X4 [Leptinotarsa decemlineata]|uniref:cuticular protein analogous to peritrophins 1-H isoform X4 n=1 Tax=Leptinotarsa decemlineata TaxID=7539 RepID=UPI003D30D53F
MKRPSGLWILLSAGVLWLSVQNVYCARPTSLKFKSTTTTTTTTTALPETSEEEGVTTEVSSEGNVTKPTLTGNPQLDYIYDPNLPKELNGYNLSDYPFYERVPEDIDFKCDGLHDGFYASVKHKCQVYHHCLFGRRYDFLCANYTAFDQTLFNCNFVSNVDCVNSKKFWNRNDELYKTKSTTAAPVNYNFYTTTSSPAYVLTPSPVQRTQPAPGFAPLPAGAPIEPRRPVGQRRPQPPPPKRTQQFEYYDEDDYEEQPRMVYRRKRPRPRPVYYDDDYEYYDERSIRRGGGRRRRPYEKRPMRKNQSRRVMYEDDDDDYRFEETGRFEDDDILPGRIDRGKRKQQNRREGFEKRRTTAKPLRKRPFDDDFEDDYDYILESKRPKQEESPRAKADPKRVQKMNMKRYLPPSLEYEDNAEETPRLRKSERDTTSRKQDESRAIIKPTTGTLYDRPRVAPRINLPVPKNAADKFAYKSMNSEPPRDLEEPSDYESRESSSESTTTTTTTGKPSRRRAAALRRNGSRGETSRNANSSERTVNTKVSNDNIETAPRDQESAEDEEIQERRADKKQAPVIVKSPLSSEEDCPDCSREEIPPIPKIVRGKPQKQGKPRVSVFKTPINSQRYYSSELDVTEKLSRQDILEGSYDESINEAY